MNKKFLVILLFLYYSLSSAVFSQVLIDKEVIVKNLFMMEPEITCANKAVSATDFYNLLDFKMNRFGLGGYEDITYYMLDSFNVKDKKIINSDIFIDREYVVAIEGNMAYRIKGFSVNDFPFLFKRCLEIDSDNSVNEILDFLDCCYNTSDSIHIDFDCLYAAFRSKEINYDKYPCLESVRHSQDVSIVMGYNNKVWRKVGGEPLGYRGTKLHKKYLIKE